MKPGDLFAEVDCHLSKVDHIPVPVLHKSQP